MIKLLHLSDVHLGARFQMLGERGREHRRQLQETFARAIGIACEEPVDLVLIAGDLFDSPHQSESTISFVREQFRRLESRGIPLCLIAGNHDPFEEGGVYAVGRFEQCSNVTLFGTTPGSKVFSQLDLTVFGSSPSPGSGRSPLAGWKVERQTRFAVGLVHGSIYRSGQVEGPETIHPEEIRGLGLDYLALGDWHSCQRVLGPPTTAWYSGSPEFLSLDQEGAGHVLLVTLEEPGSAHVRPVRVGRRSYKKIELEISALPVEEIKARILQEADPDLIMDVILKGFIQPGISISAAELEEDLGGHFFRLRVRNESSLRLEDLDEQDFPEGTVLGRFVRLMRKRMEELDPAERPLLEEALQLGVGLLQGREVL
ncbi:MAG: DNA repair exonuclease [Armatimonadota bacterium]|nr:DNA repair exonuclease [Armatimonadota bacterium]MDR5702444.1 DNA repair exonuclease [Armatimonadota bacterium]